MQTTYTPKLWISGKIFGAISEFVLKMEMFGTINHIIFVIC